jgi:hypothetical protein
VRTKPNSEKDAAIVLRHASPYMAMLSSSRTGDADRVEVADAVQVELDEGGCRAEVKLSALPGRLLDL